jgi:flagellar basal-body rod protein FlgF
VNYGLYLSASGILTSMYRQDVFANNLANVHTVGFKPDVAMVRQRDPESVEAGTGFEFENNLLDKLGGGVHAGPQHLNLTPGSLNKTSRDLDAALTDSNAFYVLSVPQGDARAEQIQLTRDGRFTVSTEGTLVSVAGGHKILDRDGRPIQLDGDDKVTLGTSGEVIQNGEVVARLQVAEVADVERLVKVGGNRLRIDGPPSLRRVIEQPRVRPGFLESSGVDPIKALMQVISATKAATSNGNLIRYHDLMMDRAVNVLGRVQA